MDDIRLFPKVHYVNMKVLKPNMLNNHFDTVHTKETRVMESIAFRPLKFSAEFKIIVDKLSESARIVSKSFSPSCSICATMRLLSNGLYD